MHMAMAIVHQLPSILIVFMFAVRRANFCAPHFYLHSWWLAAHRTTCRRFKINLNVFAVRRTRYCYISRGCNQRNQSISNAPITREALLRCTALHCIVHIHYTYYDAFDGCFDAFDEDFSIALFILHNIICLTDYLTTWKLLSYSNG